MNLACSSRMIKYLMFAFNLFFVISGIIIIVVGATVRRVYSDYSDFLDWKYFTLPNMLIATGAFIFFASFFGCCGAITGSWIMHRVFFIFLCIIFILEFSAGIAGYELSDKTIDYVDSKLKNYLKTYNRMPSAHIWDSIQSSFQCCGVDSYHDWSYIFADPFALPVSCCPLLDGTAGIFYCNSYIPTFPTASTEGTTTPPTTPPTATRPTTTPPVTTPQRRIIQEEAPMPSEDGSKKEAIFDILARHKGLTSGTSLEGERTIPASTSFPYQIGCKTPFGQYIKKQAGLMTNCALGLAIIQILGIFFYCHLISQLKSDYYRKDEPPSCKK